MVTFRFCCPKLLVRFQPPHPFLFFVLFFLLLSPSVFASDYSTKEDVNIFDLTLPEFAQDEASPFSLNTTMPTGSFYLPSKYDNVIWRWSQRQNMITSASDFSTTMWNRLDDGDKTLMGAIANVVTGLDNKINENKVSVPVLDQWINTKAAPEIANGVGHTGLSVPNLLAVLASNDKSFYDRNERLMINRALNWYDISGNFGVGAPVGDLLALVTKNQKAAYEKLGFNSTRSAWAMWEGSFVNYGTGLTVPDMLAISTSNQIDLSKSLKSWLTNNNLNEYGLSLDGISKTVPNTTSLFHLNRDGFLGLANLIAGSYDKKGSKPGIAVFWTDPNNPLLPSERPEVYDNLFDFFSIWAGNVDRSLVKLQYVLANDEDIELEDQEKPNKDQVKDDFFGDGEGAVAPSDIKDASGLTSGVKDTFAGAGSASDAFQVANDSGSYSFFSQEVANDLDQVSNPSPVSVDDDSWLEQFELGEDGFLAPRDSADFNVELYLEGLLK